MALILKRLYNGYFWLFNEVADPRGENYFMMSDPLLVTGLLTLYFKFIYNWGPRFMENRPPYKLKEIMIVYNIIQILVNLYLSYQAILLWIIFGVVKLECAEIDYTENGRFLLNLTYIYYITKVTDLLDTVFFVLRKKYNQVSFLHVYHHFGMVALSWIGVKFIGGGHSVFLGAINAVVHTFMYMYYLLTVINEKYKTTLWLKKFITQIQLAQFMFLLYAYGKLLFKEDCAYPKFAVYFFVPQNLFMTLMFADFYYKAYIRRKPQESQLKNAAKSD